MKHTTSSPWSIENSTRHAGPLAGIRHTTCAWSAAVSPGSPPHTCSRREGKRCGAGSEDQVASAKPSTPPHTSPGISTTASADLPRVRGDEVGPARGGQPSSAISSSRRSFDREDIACDFQRVEAYLFPGPTGRALREEKSALRTARAAFEQVGPRSVPGSDKRPGDSVPDSRPVPPAEVPLRHRRADPQERRRHPHRHDGRRQVRGGTPCKVDTKAGNT